MKALILSLASLLLVLPTVDSSDILNTLYPYSVTFKIKNFGSWVHGSLKELKVTGNFDQDDLANSKIKGTVEVKTIDTGNEKRDDHLRRDDYFHAEKYPFIIIQSERFVEEKEATYFEGTVTIKGTTQDVRFPVDLKALGKSTQIKGSFELNRRDFEVGGGSLILNNKVVITIECVLN